MTSDDMAFIKGMELHGSKWRIKKRIPKALKSFYSKTFINLTAASPVKKDANVELHKLVADQMAEFERLVKTGTKARTNLTDAEVKWLVDYMLAHSLRSYNEALQEGSLESSQVFDAALRWIHQGAAAVLRGEEPGLLAIGVIVDKWLADEGFELSQYDPQYRRVIVAFAQGICRNVDALKAIREGDWQTIPEVPKRPNLDAEVFTQPKILCLSDVVDSFLDRQIKTKSMYRKYTAVLGLLKDVLGAKPIEQLRQIDIDGFFKLVCQLPPRWKDEARRFQCSVRDLAEMDWASRLGPKTYEDTYMAAFRPFLRESIRLYGDQGFPRTLVCEGIRYTGVRKEGERKQRGLRPDEIRGLFGSINYARFCKIEPESYWLPLVGLYTGARINEVCQLNPQCDIREEHGTWFFDFTEESEGDERITKRVKTSTSKRRVPIHTRLLSLGFLEYAEATKAKGAKLLFPGWAPSRGKASAKAEKWFRQLLSDVGIRDDTPHKTITGFHCFRATFAAKAQEVGVDKASILGHASESQGTVVQRGYRGPRPLNQLSKIVEAVTFDDGCPIPSFVV